MFYTPTTKLINWQALLADPQKQWVRKYSAFELAHAWTRTETFPENVQSLLNNCEHESLHNLEMVLKVPEHEVELDTGISPSQNDLFVLARTDSDLVTIMVEGKVKEQFGPKVEDWLIDASPAKRNRLNFLMIPGKGMGQTNLYSCPQVIFLKLAISKSNNKKHREVK